MPEQALRAVQFIHPGGEHHPDAPGIKRWNRGAHQRKFMCTAGISLDATREVQAGEVLLWGEWEPPSTVEVLEAPGPDYPRYLHRPFLEPRTEFAGQQNTDPFVFRDTFLYTGCQQWRGKPHGNPVQLRYLLPGSIILFGSCAGDRFLLDTVFVVRDFIDHDRDDYLDVLEAPSQMPTGPSHSVLGTRVLLTADRFVSTEAQALLTLSTGCSASFLAFAQTVRQRADSPAPTSPNCPASILDFAKAGAQRSSATLPRRQTYGTAFGKPC